MLIGHGVPADLIAQTFAEAKRLHELRMDTRLALRLNDHNNGFMASGRYVVWTSDVNKDDRVFTDMHRTRRGRGMRQRRSHYARQNGFAISIRTSPGSMPQSRICRSSNRASAAR